MDVLFLMGERIVFNHIDQSFPIALGSTFKKASILSNTDINSSQGLINFYQSVFTKTQDFNVNFDVLICNSLIQTHPRNQHIKMLAYFISNTQVMKPLLIERKPLGDFLTALSSYFKIHFSESEPFFDDCKKIKELIDHSLSPEFIIYDTESTLFSYAMINDSSFIMNPHFHQLAVQYFQDNMYATLESFKKVFYNKHLPDTAKFKLSKQLCITLDNPFFNQLYFYNNYNIVNVIDYIEAKYYAKH
jgi:hypothetical protein